MQQAQQQEKGLEWLAAELRRPERGIAQKVALLSDEDPGTWGFEFYQRLQSEYYRNRTPEVRRKTSRYSLSRAICRRLEGFRRVGYGIGTPDRRKGVLEFNIADEEVDEHAVELHFRQHISQALKKAGAPEMYSKLQVCYRNGTMLIGFDNPEDRQEAFLMAYARILAREVVR